MSKKLLFNFNREVIQNYTYVKYVGTIITATNTLEKPIKSASLKGSTKYRDIDTGEFLETFEDGRNLELVSVKMPVLTTYTNLFTGFINRGYINADGNAAALGNNQNMLSDFIEVKFNSIAFRRFKKDGTPVNSFGEFAFYDKNKNFISRRISMDKVDESITLPNNTRYIRIWSKPVDKDDGGWDELAVLIYSNEAPSQIKNYLDNKTNILTVNEPIELHGIGAVQDTLDCLTGEVTQRIEKTTITGDLVSSVISPGHNNNSETMCFERFDDIIPFQWNQIISADWSISGDNFNPSMTHEFFNPNGGYGIFRIKRSRLETEDANGFKKWLNENPITIYHPVIGSESIKTVDLSVLDQNENKVSSISSFNDTTHITASSETIPPIFEGYLATKEVE